MNNAELGLLSRLGIREQDAAKQATVRYIIRDNPISNNVK